MYDGSQGLQGIVGGLRSCLKREDCVANRDNRTAVAYTNIDLEHILVSSIIRNSKIIVNGSWHMAQYLILYSPRNS